MSLWGLIRGIPEAIATVADIVELVRWLAGDPAKRPPLILSKIPAETRSAAQRIRERSIAANEFAAAHAAMKTKGRQL